MSAWRKVSGRKPDSNRRYQSSRLDIRCKGGASLRPSELDAAGAISDTPNVVAWNGNVSSKTADYPCGYRIPLRSSISRPKIRHTKRKLNYRPVFIPGRGLKPQNELAADSQPVAGRPGK